ncbi:MAG: hypothetical protein VBE63_16240 [Lamprobacter sp.]|uniref:hypothetical protein n=1 Tax=Lamprobacter sp. TaxID=3100796 RepID=UPI002B258537|nr:hypothetical protein [Lamprobacter sp.]MEA3641474.1 hypothetical protein [Lamprobacter sp.]
MSAWSAGTLSCGRCARSRRRESALAHPQNAEQSILPMVEAAWTTCLEISEQPGLEERRAGTEQQRTALASVMTLT